jgi:hypothetical protein
MFRRVRPCARQCRLNVIRQKRCKASTPRWLAAQLDQCVTEGRLRQRCTACQTAWTSARSDGAETDLRMLLLLLLLLLLS